MGSSESEPVPVELLVALRAVADPRARRGVRHGFVALLAVAVCGVGRGAQLRRDRRVGPGPEPGGVVRLGLRRAAPSESTIRRVLQGVDAQELDSVLSAWLLARCPAPVRGVIAIDGKSARGARGPDGRPTHLLAAFDQSSGVLGQNEVNGKTNEITAFAPVGARNSAHLMRPADIRGAAR